MARPKKRRQSKHRPTRQEDQQPRGVRPFWSGTISFGLVSVPVQLFPAHRGGGTALRMLADDGTPLSRRFYCPDHDVDVHPEHIVRGYQTGNGTYVLVRDDELESLRPRASRDIDLRRFVTLESIPPVLFERGYFLTPSGESTKAYRLLAEVMERTGRAGIATFVMHDKEYLVAIVAEHGILKMETLRFELEIRSPAAVGLMHKQRIDRKEVAAFKKAIRKLERKVLDPAELADGYRQRLRQLVDRKYKRRDDVVEVNDGEQEEGETDGPETDLISAIRRSLAGRNAPGRHRQSQHAGNGRLEEQPRSQLYEHARRLDIPGRSRMSKRKLAAAIRGRR